ncbi:hypothetical protein [Tumebacillus permanentifrigoris]|nr:hypothetical protein [Tumebacillus permanentifrigoris]
MTTIDAVIGEEELNAFEPFATNRSSFSQTNNQLVFFRTLWAVVLMMTTQVGPVDADKAAFQGPQISDCTECIEDAPVISYATARIGDKKQAVRLAYPPAYHDTRTSTSEENVKMNLGSQTKTFEYFVKATTQETQVDDESEVIEVDPRRATANSQLKNAYNGAVTTFGILAFLGVVGVVVVPSIYRLIPGVFALMSVGMGTVFFVDYVLRGKKT